MWAIHTPLHNSAARKQLRNRSHLVVYQDCSNVGNGPELLALLSPDVRALDKNSPAGDSSVAKGPMGANAERVVIPVKVAIVGRIGILFLGKIHICSQPSDHPFIQTYEGGVEKNCSKCSYICSPIYLVLLCTICKRVTLPPRLKVMRIKPLEIHRTVPLPATLGLHV